MLILSSIQIVHERDLHDMRKCSPVMYVQYRTGYTVLYVVISVIVN